MTNKQKTFRTLGRSSQSKMYTPTSFYFQHWDSTIPGLNTSIINEERVNEWSDIQRSQHLMISFASYLFGMRLRVYRAEGTTQWYTAVSTGYNANTQVNFIKTLYLPM